MPTSITRTVAPLLRLLMATVALVATSRATVVVDTNKATVLPRSSMASNSLSMFRASPRAVAAVVETTSAVVSVSVAVLCSLVRSSALCKELFTRDLSRKFGNFTYCDCFLSNNYSVYLYSSANSLFASRLSPSPHSGSIRKNVARDNVLTWNYSSTGKIDHSSFSYVLMKLLLQQTN